MATTITAITSGKIQSVQEKAAEINLLLLQPDVDLWRLRELALSEGGLVNDTLRQRAWPKLVGLHKFDDASSNSSSNTNTNSNSNSNSKGGTQDEHGNANEVDGTASSQQQQQQQQTSSANPDWFSLSEEAPSSSTLQSPTDKTQQTQPQELPQPTSPSKQSRLICESLDVDQIDRDVARCTWHLLTGTQRYRRFQYRHKSSSKKVATVLRRKQKRLANLINVTLVQSYDEQPPQLQPDAEDDDDVLRYYQGYHDVASVFLSTLGGGGPGTPPSASTSNVSNLQSTATKHGLDLPARVLKQVSFSHFRDAMRSSFGHLQNAIRMVIFPLLQQLDPEVHDYLYDCSMEPFFCLSWILTWFSHDVRDTELVKRLFDAFVVSHPLLPLYVAIAMILHPYNRQWIMSTECDFASLHHVLASLPRNSSAVGWKLRLGPDGFEGYVSDNEDEDDDDTALRRTGNDANDSLAEGTATTEMEHYTMTSSLAQDSDDNDIDDDDGSTDSYDQNTNNMESDADTIMSRSVGPIGCNFNDSSVERVPFQELIDQALMYMKRFPPRSLAKLAPRYYKSIEDGNDDTMGMVLPSPSMDLVPTTALLNPTPAWAVAATAKADWVLKQRARAKLGKRVMTRKDKRRRRRAEAAAANANSDMASVYSINTGYVSSAASAYGTFENSESNNDDTACEDVGDDTKTVVTRNIDPNYVKHYSNSRAVVASGNGGPSEEEERRIRRRRNRTWTNAAIVGVFALSVVVTFQYYRSGSSQSSGGKRLSANTVTTTSSVRSSKATKSTGRSSSNSKDSENGAVRTASTLLATSSAMPNTGFASNFFLQLFSGQDHDQCSASSSAASTKNAKPTSKNMLQTKSRTLTTKEEAESDAETSSAAQSYKTQKAQELKLLAQISSKEARATLTSGAKIQKVASAKNYRSAEATLIDSELELAPSGAILLQQTIDKVILNTGWSGLGSFSSSGPAGIPDADHAQPTSTWNGFRNVLSPASSSSSSSTQDAASSFGAIPHKATSTSAPSLYRVIAQEHARDSASMNHFRTEGRLKK